MTRQQVVDLLMARNPRTKRAQVEQYAAVWLTLQEAQDNIDRNGAVVAHPKTGGPIENPYLSVRERAMRQLGQFAISGTAGLPWGGAAAAPAGDELEPDQDGE